MGCNARPDHITELYIHCSYYYYHPQTLLQARLLLWEHPYIYNTTHSTPSVICSIKLYLLQFSLQVHCITYCVYIAAWEFDFVFKGRSVVDLNG